MQRTSRRWHGWLVGMSVLAMAGPAWANEPHPDLEVGPETTVVDGPWHADGTPDYVAALDAMQAEKVEAEANAFVPIAKLIAPRPGEAKDETNERHWDLVFERLGVDRPGEGELRFVPFEAFLEEHGEDVQNPYDRYRQRSESPWQREEDPLVSEWLEANAEALAVLAEAVQRPKYYTPLVSPKERPLAIEVLTPHLAEMRRMTHALIGRAQRSVGEGDLEAAWADVLTAKRLARRAKAETTLSGVVTATIIDGLAHDAVATIASSEHLTPDAARAMMADAEAFPVIEVVAAKMDVAVRLASLDELFRLWGGHERAFENLFVFGDQDIRERLDGMVGRESFDINIALRALNESFNEFNDSFGSGDRRDSARAMRSYGDRIYAEFGAPWTPDRMDRLERHWEEVVAEEGERAASKVLATPVAAFFLPPGSGALESEMRQAGRAALEPVALALAGYRSEHGDYPEALEDLVPAWLEGVPNDPFTEGEPVRYVREDDHMIVYIIGPTLEDHGGVDDPREGDLVIPLQR